MDNRTRVVALITVCSFLGIVFLGIVLLALFRPDASATVINFAGTVFAVAASFFGTLFVVSQYQKKTTTETAELKSATRVIARSVNGNTERLLSLVWDRLTDDEKARYQLNQEHLSAVAEGRASEES